MLLKIFKCVYCLPLLFAIQSLHATNYYLSVSGNDRNTGTSRQQCWQTINRLNKQKLQPGDSVLFMRGNTFYGKVICNYSGLPAKPIVYTAYGNGDMPIITGALPVTNFQPYKNNIYAASFNDTVKAVFINNHLQLLARYPNSGFKIMQGGVGNTVTFTDSSLTQPNGYWHGANVRFRTWDWEIRTSLVTNYSNNQVTIKDSSTNTLGKGWGYFFDNKLEALDTAGEWFYDYNAKKLLLYSDTKINVSEKFEAVILTTGISVAKNVHHVTISFLQVEKFFETGILLAGDNHNIQVNSNTIKQMDKTGIYVNDIAVSCNIANNKIYDINGRGIFALEPEHLLIEKNNLFNIGNIMGYGISGVNGMIAITIANKEAKKQASDHIAHHNIIQKNKVDSTGYVGIRMDGAYSKMEYNTISNALCNLSDGAAVYCWAISKNYTHDNTIRYNIISNVTGSNYGTPSGPSPAANGIYIDNQCYNILVAKNTLLNISASGIHVNSDAYDNVVKNNTIYNCNTALSLAEWATAKATYGNLLTGNQVFLLKPNQRGIVLMNFLLPYTKGMASFNNNQYYHLWGDTLMTDIYNTKYGSGNTQRVTNEYDFAAIQNKMGYEINGKSIRRIKGMANVIDSKILYNVADKNKAFNPGNGEWYNLQGRRVTRIAIAPYQSVIVVSGEEIIF